MPQSVWKFQPFGLVVLALAMLAASAPARADEADENAPYHKLTWDDFKGTAPTGTEDAETFSGPVASWNSDNAQPDGDKFKCPLKDIVSKATMDKTQSGVKDGTQTASLLEHEQYHFDIDEYWAREMEKQLKAVVGTGDTEQEAIDDAEAKAEAIKADIGAKVDAMQAKYDDETDHGRKAEEQAAWCTKVSDLLNPPKPKDNKGTSTPGNSSYDPGTKQLHVDGFTLGSFTHVGTPWPDPWLSGASLEFPELVYSGYQMDDAHPLMMANPDTAGVFRIRTIGGIVALEGRMRLLMGSQPDTAYTAWIEATVLDPLSLASSPFLQFVEQSRATGRALFGVQLSLATALSVATDDWWLPAVVPTTVTVGSTDCDPPLPPILVPPVSHSVPPGGNTRFSVFVAAGGPFTYHWRKNHLPLSDGVAITGASTDTLRIAGCVPGDAGDYEVLVIGPCGATTSASATLSVTAPSRLAASTFDTDADGWLNVMLPYPSAVPPTILNTYLPAWQTGYLWFADPDGSGSSGDAQYWMAPPKFLGNKLSAYGDSLLFDLADQGSGFGLFHQEDVILLGGGLTLVHDLATSMDGAWHHLGARLLESDWRSGGLAGPVATMVQLQTVLSSLTGIFIRAEYQLGPDTQYLDNVILQSATAGAATAAEASRLELAAPVPNPSRETALIDFALPAAGETDLAVFDVSGRRVATLVHGSLGAGRHSASWDGRGAGGRRVRAGLYFVRLSGGAGRATRGLVRVE